jgi:hypothetical protein
VVGLLLLFFFLYQFQGSEATHAATSFSQKAVLLGVLLAMLFVVNFIVKKNGLTKNSSYTILFYLLLLLFFPAILGNLKLLLANFFLMIAMRRLISLQSLKAPKEKIFDASLWIFVASLFHFWCILFILLVFISIIFHVSRDYRNWLLPFVAFFTIAVIFVLASLIYNIAWVDHFLAQTKINFQLDYFTNNYQNIALSIYVVLALYFVMGMIFSVSNKPIILQASFKKMIFAFLIGIVCFLVSQDKNNTILAFTFMPLSIMATSNIEYSQSKMYQEIILALFITFGVFCFFSQL